MESFSNSDKQSLSISGFEEEHHSSTDSLGWVTLESSPQVTVRLSSRTGLNKTTRASLEAAFTEALTALLEQDSPFARTLITGIQSRLGFDDVQEQLLAMGRVLQERSSALQDRIDRRRSRRA